MPSSVEVTFNAQPASNPAVVKTVTLASLALARYLFVTTNPTGTAVLYSSQLAEYNDANALTNDAALAALAGKIAEDYYLWNLSKVDLVLPGIVPWSPDGDLDAVEWTHVGSAADPGSQISTRIQRAYYYTYVDLATAVGLGNTSILNITDNITNVKNVTNITIINGTITDNGDGSVTVTGGSGGDINYWKASGQLYTCNHAGSISSGAQLPYLGYMYALPLIVTRSATINICSTVRTPVDAALYPNARMGIALYDVGGGSSILPRNAIVFKNNIVTNDSNPNADEGLYDLGSSVAVSPGLYWWAVTTNGNGEGGTAPGCMGLTEGPTVFPGPLQAYSTEFQQMTWLLAYFTDGGLPVNINSVAAAGFPANPNPWPSNPFDHTCWVNGPSIAPLWKFA